jgi:hypothetical protein
MCKDVRATKGHLYPLIAYLTQLHKKIHEPFPFY